MKKRIMKIWGSILLLALILIPNITAMADNANTSWKTVASKPGASANVALYTHVVDDKIYTIDDHTREVQVYNPVTDKWTTLASVPSIRQEFETAVIDGKIYAIGGYDVKNSKYVTSVEVYNPATDTWVTLASMTTARSSFVIKVIDGKIYVIGGYNGSYLASVEAYDPATNKWTTLASMPTEKGCPTVVANGKIYAIGGYDSKNKKFSTTVEVYDPATNKWTTLASMPVGKSSSMEVIDGKIYTIGGYNGSYLASVEVYDPATDKWTTLASMPIVKSCNTVVANRKIYVIGGRNKKCLATVEVYDPATDKWTTLDSLQKRRRGSCLEVLNGKIYVIGGRNDLNTTVASVEVYTTSEGSTTQTPPAKLIATGGISKVDLAWPKVKDATSYTIKRATMSGGPYTSIASGITNTAYTDTAVVNGTIYYYVIIVIKDDSESWNSNEASATPTASIDSNQTGNRALLVITMQNGERKEYDLTMERINDFITWYNNNPASSPTYVIEKNYNKASFASRKDYISYAQISSVEVNEYNN